MRDMQGSGVATTHGGIPMWMVLRHQSNIRASLHGKVNDIRTSATSSFEDFIGPDISERAVARRLNSPGKLKPGILNTRGALLDLISGETAADEKKKDLWDDFHVTQAAAYG